MRVRTVSTGFRRLALAMAPALALIGITWQPAQAIVPPPTNAFHAINEYSNPTPTGTFDIITGPDGNIWYSTTEFDDVIKASPYDGSTLGTVVLGDHSPSCAPAGLTIGPDKNIWVACFNGASVVRINPSTLATKVYHLPTTAAITSAHCSCPLFLTAGPDGYLWFDENGPGYISKLNVTTGALTRYALPAGHNADPRGITVGPDGKIWFAEGYINRIGRMTTSGVLTTFAPPTFDSYPWGIAPGPDGYLYYTEANGNNIGRISTSGVSTEFPIPTPSSDPRMINVGPDGNLWFAEAANTANKVGAMTTDGFFQEVAVPTSGSTPFGIGAGPDGNVWFSEINANQFGKIGARHSVLTLDKTGIGWGNVEVGATPAAQTITLTNNGAESLAAFTPSTGGSGASGTFSQGTQTCSAGAIVAAGTCTSDAGFTASSVPGAATGSASFVTDSGSSTRQSLAVGLSATVNVPACRSVAVAPSMTSPQNVGVTFNLVATSAGCPDASPRYRFYLRSPAGVWSVVQDFSTNDTFVWNTTTFKAGTYLIGVWVKDALSTKTYDAYAFGTFTLQFPYCTFTSLASDVPSPQASGATVNFTATTSTSCPDPLHQWWVRNAAGVWSIAVPFAVGTAFAWNTTGLPDGTYQIGVWAKQTGSSKSYDAFAFVTYTLTTVAGTTHCQAVNVDAVPGSPQSQGTSVTLTATAQGCDTPQYKWWVRDTSAVWAVVQNYPGSNSFIFTTTSRLPGTYLLGVWVRQTGSTAAYEAYSFITYTLTIAPVKAPCTSVGISPDVPSPQVEGATVTFTAAALGCSTPEYKFFIAPPPSGVFGVVQPYGASDTFVWDTTGLSAGPYQIGVWARHSGSTAAYESFAFITFQITSSGTPCSVLSIFPSRWTSTNDYTSQSPQPTGLTYTWNASASGCGSAEYAFYVQAPGSSTFKVIRSYSATATASWNTAGLPRGVYKVKVLARLIGSGTSYDVFATSTYELV